VALDLLAWAFQAARGGGLPSAVPVRAFPAASANMTAAVTAVQVMPGTECRGW
jgi:hypothetical protein